MTMRFPKKVFAPILLVFLGACPTGAGVKGFTPATSPRGVVTTLHLQSGRMTAELLAIDDSSFVLSNGCTVYVAPFRVVRAASFKGIGTLSDEEVTDRDALKLPRLSSRFPAGISPRVMQELLKCSGMSAPQFLPIASASGGSQQSVASESAAAAPAFLAAAKESAQRFQSLDSAIAAGYRRIGGDLPSLGEHWVHAGLLMSNTFEARQPSIVIYVRDPRGPRLAGAAWTKLLRGVEAYPEFPAGRTAWHEHNGTIAEETLPLHHLATGSSTSATRVAVLHAWLWIDNPRGVWAAENWALPFVRAGLVPQPGSEVGARGLSLTTPGAVDYYLRVLAATAGSDSATLGWARSVIADASAQATAVRSEASGQLGEHQLRRLGDIWTGLWERLSRPPRGK